MTLFTLGWNDQLAQLFAPYSTLDLLPARVVRAERGRYLLSDGQQEWAGEISGRLRHALLCCADLPAVGDWVGLRHAGEPGPALIDLVLPRSSRFRRNAAGGRTEEQILAANIDWLLVVVGLDGDYSLRRIERFLTAAEDSGAEVAILLNKADCRPDAIGVQAEVQGVRVDLRVVLVSALTGQGLDELAALLEPRLTYALVGSSGAGKSTLINRLLGSERLTTAAVRARDDRGCHTTTRRELVVMPQGSILMDTPGLRELALWAAGDTPWEGAFPDLAELAKECRFRDCQHRNEPGCAVRSALERGDLDEGRYRSYEKQQRELDYQRARQDQRAAQLRSQRRREIARASRDLGKLRGKWS
jgi:ribosome biogenesis GTPase